MMTAKILREMRTSAKKNLKHLTAGANLKKVPDEKMFTTHVAITSTPLMVRIRQRVENSRKVAASRAIIKNP